MRSRRRGSRVPRTDVDPSVRGAGGRTAVQLALDRTYGPFVFGKLLSSCGIWVQNLAAAVLMFNLTRSAFMVGLVSVVQFSTTMTLSLWTGSLSDRYSRRALIVAGRMMSTGAGSALAVALWRWDVTPAPLLGFMLVMGFGLALSSPAQQAIVPALVPPEDLEQALALSSAGPSIARAVGPALGAGLLLLGGPALAFLAAAGGHAAFAVLLVFVRDGTGARTGKPRASILGGVRYLREDPACLVLLLGLALLGFGADPAITLTPSLAAQLGGGEELVGAFASAFGLGAVLLTLGFRFVRSLVSLRTATVGGFLAIGSGLLLVAFAVGPVLSAVGFAVAGGGFLTAQVSLSTAIQRRVPDAVRGRMMALWTVAFIGSRPVAAAVNGAIADVHSVQAAVLVTVAITLASGVLFLATREGDLTGPAPAATGAGSSAPGVVQTGGRDPGTP